MHNIKYYFYILISLLILSGCSTTLKGPSFQSVESPPSDKGYVYIYWAEESKEAPGLTFDILVNGEAITTMKRGGYYLYKAEPGQIDIEASPNFSLLNMALLDMAMTSNKHFTLDVTAGKTYFMRCYLSGGYRNYKLPMDQTFEDRGLKEIKTTKLLSPA